MSAAIWNGASGVHVVDHPIPDPRDELVLVRVHLAGVCATDRLVARQGLDNVQPPLVLGHEVVGTVKSAPPAASHLLGRRVVVDPAPSTGTARPLGELGLERDGAWAQFCLTDTTRVHVVPEAMADEQAALTEPLTMTWGAVHAQRDLVAGSNVAVVGDGIAAYGFAAAAAAHDAAAIAVSGRASERAPLFDPVPRASYGVAEPPADLFDVTIDAVGTSASLARAVAAARPGGHVMLYGLHEPVLSGFPLAQVVMKNLTLSGHTNPPAGWDDVLVAIAHDVIPTRHLPLRIIDLDSVADVLDGDPPGVVRTMIDLRDGRTT